MQKWKVAAWQCLQEAAKGEKNEGVLLARRETMQREWWDQLSGKSNGIWKSQFFRELGEKYLLGLEDIDIHNSL